MEILRLMGILLLVILVIVIGSKVVYKDDFVVIEGSITLDANTQENINLYPEKCKKTSKEIDFPTGLNKDNCILIGIDFKYDTQRGYASGWNNYTDSGDMLRGTLPYHFTLGADRTSTKMTLAVGNMAPEERSIHYRIVLMKIS